MTTISSLQILAQNKLEVFRKKFALAELPGSGKELFTNTHIETENKDLDLKSLEELNID